MKVRTIILWFCLVTAVAHALRGRSSCYDDAGRAQRCMPEFSNAAFGLPVDASNTCGVTNETEFCVQSGAQKPCYICDARTEGLNHPPEFMTDFNKPDNRTWWQSETMLEGVQFPNTVSLTLNLRKAFDITYVRIRFMSPRPESFAIYKRTEMDGPWIPYQFYSASCESTYNLPRRGVITAANEAVAICTDEFSDISPLTGGSVAFSTLEGRPSAYTFNESPVLQDWVTATGIQIVLTRMNTFGDEKFGDPRVLKSYFYAVSDLAVGARCKCNGHASSCQIIRDQNLEEQRVCQCEHHTTGPDCGRCLPLYNGRPWARATEHDANECQPSTTTPGSGVNSSDGASTTTPGSGVNSSDGSPTTTPLSGANSSDGASTTTPGLGGDGGGGDETDFAVIVGIIIAVLVIVITVIVSIVLFVRRKKSTKDKEVCESQQLRPMLSSRQLPADVIHPRDDDAAAAAVPGTDVRQAEPGLGDMACASGESQEDGEQTERFHDDHDPTSEYTALGRSGAVDTDDHSYTQINFNRKPPTDDFSESVASDTKPTE